MYNTIPQQCSGSDILNSVNKTNSAPCGQAIIKNTNYVNISNNCLISSSQDTVDNQSKQVCPNQVATINIIYHMYIVILLLFSCVLALYHDRLFGSSNQDYDTSFNNYGFTSKGLKICSHNVNRLENKLDEIRYNLLQSKNPPDILGCCETFFSDIILDTDIRVPGYTMIRKDRTTNRGGGWAVYINENLPFERKEQFEISNIETVWFEIRHPYKKSFLLCFVYRNPKSSSVWIDQFEKEIQFAIDYNNDLVLTGVFNMDFLSPNKPPQKWLNIMDTYSLQQLLTEPTRKKLKIQRH